MDKYWGHRNKKHKKQPFADASASHLPLVLWHVWFQAGAWISHTTPLTPPSYEVGGIAKRIKTARLRRKTKPGRDVILHVRPQFQYYIDYQLFGTDGARTKFANQNVGTCLWHVSMQTENYQRITQHAEGMSLRYGVIVLRNLTQPPTKKSFDH